MIERPGEVDARLGLYSGDCCQPPTRVADPLANAQSVLRMLERHRTSSVIVCGELTLSGYTCGELFGQAVLLRACLQALEQVALATAATGQLVAVGLPLQVGNGLYNVAAVLADGRVVAVVPKQFLPNSQEFYEARWFTPAGEDLPSTVDLGPLGQVPFGIDLLMARDRLMIGIELCEDLWMPMPPSSWQAPAGAHLILNLSASNELIGKADWRQTLVRSQSGRCLAAMPMPAPARGVVHRSRLRGHCLIAENGTLLAESARVGASGGQELSRPRLPPTSICSDWSTIGDRRSAGWRLPGDCTATFGSCGWQVGKFLRPMADCAPSAAIPSYLTIRARCMSAARRYLVSRPPPWPSASTACLPRPGSISVYPAAWTARWLCWSRSRPANSAACPRGGWSASPCLDSELARELYKPRGRCSGNSISNPGRSIFGSCAWILSRSGTCPFGIALEGLSLSEFDSQLAELPPERRHDLVFENVQARVRTLLLMNCGFVLGTGDLSEQALGWSTYNGDHMSMYNVNTSFPKTLVRFLIQYLAQHHFQAPVRGCLLDIVAMPISPELLPTASDGDIVQKTEEAIGSYELHDFFLYHLVRFGTEPRKLLHLSRLAGFEDSYAMVEIRRTLAVFLRRFFANQFKRSCVPDGPKVGSVSLSPRGDWRMPSDAEVTAWLAELDTDGVA